MKSLKDETDQLYAVINKVGLNIKVCQFLSKLVMHTLYLIDKQRDGPDRKIIQFLPQFEEATKESNRVADQADCDIRDYGKKVHGFEIEFDETTDKLNKALAAYEEKDKVNIVLVIFLLIKNLSCEDTQGSGG